MYYVYVGTLLEVLFFFSKAIQIRLNNQSKGADFYRQIAVADFSRTHRRISWLNTLDSIAPSNASNLMFLLGHLLKSSS